MKLIIAGSRVLSPTVEEISRYVARFHLTGKITEVVCGGVDGVDKAGEVWGNSQGITVRRFNAQWEKYGRRAEPVRNMRMGDYGDELLLIWDGKSTRSSHMKWYMVVKGKPIWEVVL